MSDVVIIVLIAIVFVAMALVLPQWMLLRTVPKVIRIFRAHNAIGEKNAKTIGELGLHPKTIFERMLKMRDYKPRTLQFLLKTTVIEMTEDGKVYLSEENLSQTRWRML